jgi:hypothetical protein
MVRSKSSERNILFLCHDNARLSFNAEAAHPASGISSQTGSSLALSIEIKAS